MINNVSEDDLEELRLLFISRGPRSTETLQRILNTAFEEYNNLALSGNISDHNLSFTIGKASALKEVMELVEKSKSHKTGGVTNGNSKGRSRLLGQ